jgi:hypothetical protein
MPAPCGLADADELSRLVAAGAADHGRVYEVRTLRFQYCVSVRWST